MKNIDEAWEELAPYLTVDNALEQGFSNGKYTRILAGYAKNVTGIDTSIDFKNMAEDNLKDLSNIELYIMDAKKMNFNDKSFDVILNTSFHEFDLSHGKFSMDLDLKKEILTEMIRVSDTIVFMEPTDSTVTNDLFSVFDPSENHSYRIKKSNELISEFMKDNDYELICHGLTFSEDKFNTKEELEEAMLDWWADIKIPKDDIEKQEMITKIDEILEQYQMLDKLHVIENISYNVYRRRG